MSVTSSLFTAPSLSRSSIWNASRIVRTWEGCNWDSAFPCPTVFVTAGRGVLRCWGMYASGTPSTVECPRDVRNSEMGLVTGLLVNLAPPSEGPCLVGDDDGVVCRNVDGDAGDAGDAGDCGRRNGEDRCDTDPYPSGDGLYPDACVHFGQQCAKPLFSHQSYHICVAVSTKGVVQVEGRICLPPKLVSKSDGQRNVVVGANKRCARENR